MYTEHIVGFISEETTYNIQIFNLKTQILQARNNTDAGSLIHLAKQ